MAYNKETGEYKGFIYCITNKVNNKKYIGQTNRNIEVRYAEHIRHSKLENSNNDGNKVLFKAMRKYGVDNFSCSVIKTVYDKNKEDLGIKLNIEEINFIKEYNTLIPNGYHDRRWKFRWVYGQKC